MAGITRTACAAAAAVAPDVFKCRPHSPPQGPGAFVRWKCPGSESKNQQHGRFEPYPQRPESPPLGQVVSESMPLPPMPKTTQDKAAQEARRITQWANAQIARIGEGMPRRPPTLTEVEQDLKGPLDKRIKAAVELYKMQVGSAGGSSYYEPRGNTPPSIRSAVLSPGQGQERLFRASYA